MFYVLTVLLTTISYRSSGRLNDVSLNGDEISLSGNSVFVSLIARNP